MSPLDRLSAMLLLDDGTGVNQTRPQKPLQVPTPSSTSRCQLDQTCCMRWTHLWLHHYQHRVEEHLSTGRKRIWGLWGASGSKGRWPVTWGLIATLSSMIVHTALSVEVLLLEGCLHVAPGWISRRRCWLRKTETETLRKNQMARLRKTQMERLRKQGTGFVGWMLLRYVPGGAPISQRSQTLISTRPNLWWDPVLLSLQWPFMPISVSGPRYTPKDISGSWRRAHHPFYSPLEGIYPMTLASFF